MRARAALFHHLQEFFEKDLRGVFRYGDLTAHVARPVEKKPKERRQAFGKVREIVEGSFGRYRISIESPHEAPPLGLVIFRAEDDATIEISGPIDRTTFAQIGEKVRELEHKQEESV